MKLIILDRDGVINHDSDEFIKSADEWHAIDGSINAIARLSQAGYSIVIITNQSGVGRKLLSADVLGQIHSKMMAEVEHAGGRIDSIFVCPHHPEEDCNCRKPKTGLYQQLCTRLGINLVGVPSVGDSLRDLIAAKDAGATPILVCTGNGSETRKQLSSTDDPALEDISIYKNLAKFVDALLNGEFEKDK